MKTIITLLILLFSKVNINAQTSTSVNEQCWNVVSATGGTHNLAIKEDGTLWAWGGGAALGTQGDNSLSVQVGTDNDWVLICAGYNNSIAQKSNGDIWSWGKNIFGELGNGTSMSNSFPGLINTINNVKFLSGSVWSKQAIKTDGTLWAWGYNEHG